MSPFDQFFPFFCISKLNPAKRAPEPLICRGLISVCELAKTCETGKDWQFLGQGSAKIELKLTETGSCETVKGWQFLGQGSANIELKLTGTGSCETVKDWQFLGQDSANIELMLTETGPIMTFDCMMPSVAAYVQKFVD